ncbi:MAG: hypothetical protein HWE14_08120 [Flavobacteriia bacterium]|nr:hypothetical protein [Flavobacteriia bacterium]
MQKPSLSPKIIGKQRFSFGVIMGLLTAVVMMWFLHNLTYMLLLEQLELAVEVPDFFTNRAKFLISGLAAMSGACTAMMIWFAQTSIKNIKQRRSFRSAWTFSAMLSFLVIALSIRVGFLALSSIHGADIVAPGTVEEMLSPLFYVLPLFVVLISWNPLLRAFKAYRMMVPTVLFTLTLTFIFTYAFQPPINLNKVYETRYADNIRFLDQTFLRANSEYQITFSEEEERILSMTVWSNDREVIEDDLANLLYSDRPMTLDSVLLLEIVMLKSNHGLMNQPMNRLFTEEAYVNRLLNKKYRATDSSQTEIREEIRYLFYENFSTIRLREEMEFSRHIHDHYTVSFDSQTEEELMYWQSMEFGLEPLFPLPDSLDIQFNILIDHQKFGNPILERYGHSPKYIFWSIRNTRLRNLET